MYTNNSKCFEQAISDIDSKIKQLRLMADGLNGLDAYIISKEIDRKLSEIRKNLSVVNRTIKKKDAGK